MENNNTTILGFICLTIISIVSYFIYTPVKQKIWVKNIKDSTLTISTDTIIADKSVWYYEPDSSYNKNIRLSIYRDKEGGFACMGDGLTDAEVAKLNTIVQSYATRLCRTA